MTPKLWLYVGGVAVVAGVIVAQQVRIASLKLTVANQQTEAADIRSAAEKAAREAYAEQLAEANRRVVATHGILNDELTKRQALEADLVGARAAGVSLRNAAAIAARRCSAPASPSDAASSPAAGDTGMVLTELLNSVTERAESLAELADRRGLAGETCERERDALTTR